MFTNELIDKETQFRRLKRTLEALAARHTAEPSLFPDAVVRPDELALNFENCAAAVRARDDVEVSPPQVSALAALDDQFATMSRLAAEVDADVWSEEALRTDENWEQVRRLAGEALAAFGWDTE
jgi:hypothetical protein